MPQLIVRPRTIHAVQSNAVPSQVSLLFFAAMTFVLLCAPAVATAQNTFDWSVPARYGLDADGNGLIDSFTTLAAVDPNSWPVDFTACAITLTGRRNGTNATYRWRMTRVSSGVVVADVVVVNLCTARLNVPSEGRHIGNLTISYSSVVGPVTMNFGQIVDVRDFLIVGMGDSVGSGEGDPDIPAPNSQTEETWQNRQCHRSARSGQARAAAQLEQLDTKTSVTFVHVACSGATVANGVVGNYNGAEPTGEGDVPSQVQQVGDLIGDRRIDAVLLSVGINDLDWGDVLFNCMMQLDCNRNTAAFDFAVPDPALGIALTATCALVSGPLAPYCTTFAAATALLYVFVGTSAQIVQDRVGQLSAAYDQVAAALETDLGVFGGRVFISDYLDPTRDENGSTCDPANFGADLMRTMGGLINRQEFAWAGNVGLAQINGVIGAAAAQHSWTHVNGIAPLFAAGGYCAAPASRAVRRLDDSVAIQHDHLGTMHPNERGYRHYRDRYLNFLRERFGVVGNWTFAPREATVVAGESHDYILEWKHPNVWRDLASLDLRAVADGQTAFWIHWDESADTLQLIDPVTGRAGPHQQIGGGARLETAFAAVDLDGSTTTGSGPTGSTVAVGFAIAFKNRAAGQTWQLQVRARDDSGAAQEFEDAASVFVTREGRRP